jgi:hypothetical protein
MRRFRSLISLSTLFAYLVVGVAAAQGTTVLCLQHDGSVAVEQQGSTCCEYRGNDCGSNDADSPTMPSIVNAGLKASCSYCTDIPLGQGRMSVTIAPRVKGSSHVGEWVATCASLSPLLPLEALAASPRTPSTALPLDPLASHIESVVLRC